jgi:NADH-quinone oxidoreductase subunit N
MFSTEFLSSLPGKLVQTTEGFSLILPEMVVGIGILVSIFADLFLHGKSSKFAESWRYFMAQATILLALGLAFQRMTQGMAGYVSFQLFQVNIGSNTTNTLILALGALLLGLNQLHRKGFSLEENIGFSSILLGSLLTTMSVHFLSVFLSLELISMGTYMLVAMRKDAVGARAALPYVLFGLGTSAILLYGLSLIYGLSGNMYLFSADLSRGISTADPIFAYLAVGLFSVGILFKMAWVPFHPWSPDVLESLPASWMSWISIAPKIAVSLLGIKLVRYIPLSMVSTISFLAISTILLGNLAAIGQKNSKRLLAYSSIAHGGFMAMVWLFPADQALKALLFYGFLYGISTYLVFYQVDEVTGDSIQSDDMGAWAGYAQKNPLRSATLVLGIIALIGLPPSGTFLAKVTYFSQLWEKYQSGQQTSVLALLLIAILMTAISVFYYVRIPYHIYIKKRENEEELPEGKFSRVDWSYVLLAVLLIGALIHPNLFFDLLKV